MPDSLTYEVECSLDPDVVADYDAWLPGHVRAVLSCAGFLGARIEAPQGAAGDPPRRRVRYTLESAAALEHYLENDALRLRNETAARFGDKVRCERRVYRNPSDLVAPGREPPHCLNCGEPVPSAYCAACGQAADVHMLTMGEVAQDFTHSVLHLDGRVWRTLRALVLRPGELTREFIAGRRESYLPPFRLYLVISILFFALSAVLPEEELMRVDEQDRAEIAGAAEDPEAPALVRSLANAGTQSRCDFDLNVPGLDSLDEPLMRACERIAADGGKRLAERFLATAPKLMFLFLPLIAAVALLFYWRPRRLYAEHLVLFVHNHAFVFLALSIINLMDAAIVLGLPIFWLTGVFSTALVVYLPYYVYRSMRLVYGQSRRRTLAKFSVLATIYFLLLGVTMLAGLVWSMMSL